MKRKNKGFTLVEVIVILVILAVLAAVLIPSMSTYIDKARDKQIIANARSAYVAAQTLASECYGIGKIEQFGTAEDYTENDILKLAQLDELEGVDIEFGVNTADATLTYFKYTEKDKTATLNATTGSWTVDDVEDASSND